MLHFLPKLTVYHQLKAITGDDLKHFVMINYFGNKLAVINDQGKIRLCLNSLQMQLMLDSESTQQSSDFLNRNYIRNLTVINTIF